MTRTNLTVIAIAAALLTLLIPALCTQKSDPPEVLLRSAMDKELIDGDLNAAIEQYKQVIARAGKDRAIAAKALLQMGRCHEKLGQAEARKAYERLVREYRDQKDIAMQARERLKALTRATGSVSGEAVANRRIWAGDNVDTDGSTCWDCDYLSAVDWETGDLTVRDLATGATRRLTNKGKWAESDEFAEVSAPSRDGKFIAYSWSNKQYRYELRVIDVKGGEPRILVPGMAFLQWMVPYDWSPDGKQVLAIREHRSGRFEMALVATATGEVRVLRTFDFRSPTKAVFSPDGRQIAYDRQVHEDSFQHDIFLLTLTDGTETVLMEHPANDRVLAWAPDGTMLFSSDRTGSNAVWALPMAGGAPRGKPYLLRADVGQIQPMGLTRNGSLYYGLNIGMSDIYTVEVDPVTGRALSAPVPVKRWSIGGAESPDWSPDGKHLVFVTWRGSSAREVRPLTILATETGESREIQLPLVYVFRPRWFPDGKAILVEGQDREGRSGLFRVDPQTGEAQPILLPEADTFVAFATFTPDGKKLIYHRGGAERASFVERALSTGEEKPITRQDAGGWPSGPVVSPDGRWLAYRSAPPVEKTAKGAQSYQAVSVMPASGGEARELVRIAEPEYLMFFNGIVWLPDSRSLLFSKGPGTLLGGPKEIWRVSVEGGEPQKIGVAMPGIRYLKLHPNGHTLAFAAGVAQGEIWVMENLLAEQKAPR